MWCLKEFEGNDNKEKYCSDDCKTKSNNIKYLLEHKVPKNIICTQSLNTQTIIDNEEHLTASLTKRINAARRVADKGVKVGFHFHPIVEYKGYLDEYQKIYEGQVF